MFVKCRPFYLPREFTAIVIVAVYIPLRANAKDALRKLYSAISEQQTNNPDSFFIIAAYRPLLKLTKPVQKQITVWPDNATSALQDCFQDTDWNMFKEAATYNKAALKTARANLSHGIKKAKHQYAQKINNNFSDSKDTRSLWQAIQTITDYKPLPQGTWLAIDSQQDVVLENVRPQKTLTVAPCISERNTAMLDLVATPQTKAADPRLHSSNRIIKFADDTTVVDLISNNDETHYREEVAQLAKWCGVNNLSLNVGKTKEVVMDFGRNSVDHRPLTIDSSIVERVSSTKFLGVHIMQDLTLTTNVTSLNKKGQHRLHFPCQLKRANLPPPILTTFYRDTIEIVLTSCITVWYRNCSAADRKTLQQTVNTAAKIICAPLPSILDIFLARCSSKASSIMKDPTHPSDNLFQLRPL
ncbi:hypothetical protein M9458_054564, partial [Cirrhinus mrigala]